MDLCLKSKYLVSIYCYLTSPDKRAQTCYSSCSSRLDRQMPLKCAANLCLCLLRISSYRLIYWIETSESCEMALENDQPNYSKANSTS